MSLILEALRKSERERRLGDAPSIGSPVMAVRRRRNWLPLLVVLIVLGMLLLWWLQRTPESRTPPVPSVAAQKNPAQPAARNPAQFEPMPAQDAKAASTNRRIETRPSRNPQPTRANPSAPVASAAIGAEASAPDPAKLASPTARSAPLRIPPSSAPPSEARPEPPVTATAPASTPVVPATSGAKTTPAPVSTPADTITMVWELPLATRRELPPIAISMHVYANDPAQRFIILNGERQGEGAVVDGLILKEIRKDGAVFEFSGQRFLYPRGGR